MHINIHTRTHIYMREKGGGWERTYTYIRWFITNLQETPWVDAKRNKVLLVSSADRPCWYRIYTVSWVSYWQCWCHRQQTRDLSVQWDAWNPTLAMNNLSLMHIHRQSTWIWLLVTFHKPIQVKINE
jgi:hypothetical protein